jgi:hypothetical protein
VLKGDSVPPVTKLLLDSDFLRDPAQYKSAKLGVCTFSTGKLITVAAVPLGVGSSDGVPCCAQESPATNGSRKNSTLFMIPPRPTPDSVFL